MLELYMYQSHIRILFNNLVPEITTTEVITTKDIYI